MKEQKPHIWRVMFVGRWSCTIMGDPTDPVGRGSTPEEAYEDWKAKNNK